MSYYFISGIIFFISVIVNITLKNRLKKYSEYKPYFNMSGKEVAENMLIDNKINDVKVLLSKGSLTDHYNPLDKTVNLSEKIFYEKNLVSMAVAAHECGHAIQHRFGYRLLKFRNDLVPILNFSSKITNMAIISGLTIFYASNGKDSIILKLGIGLFMIVVIFSLITLPIEFDASKKALFWLKNKNIINYQEKFRVKKALRWAAATYVISALGAITQLVYFFTILTGGDSDHSSFSDSNR